MILRCDPTRSDKHAGFLNLTGGPASSFSLLANEDLTARVRGGCGLKGLKSLLKMELYLWFTSKSMHKDGRMEAGRWRSAPRKTKNFNFNKSHTAPTRKGPNRGQASSVSHSSALHPSQLWMHSSGGTKQIGKQFAGN